MLQYRTIPETNVIEVTISGPITKESFDRLTLKIDEMIDYHGTVKLLEVVTNIGTIEPSAVWADLKWGSRRLRFFSHIAIVADQKWIEWMVAPIRMFAPGELRVFHIDELDEARYWLLGPVHVL